MGHRNPQRPRGGDGAEGTGTWQVPCTLPVWDKAGSGFGSSAPGEAWAGAGTASLPAPAWLWGQDERWRVGREIRWDQEISLPGQGAAGKRQSWGAPVPSHLPPPSLILRTQVSPTPKGNMNAELSVAGAYAA